MALAAYNSQVYVTSQPSIALTNEACTDSGDHKTYTITNQAKKRLDPRTAIVVQKANDELQTITITGGPTGGTFTLSFGGQTTSALAYNATAAQVQAALQALSSIGANNALVTGGPGPATAWVVQFTAGKGQVNQALMTSTSSLTGGTTPTITITETQAGGPFATISTGFTLSRVNARVIFAVAQPTGTYVQFASAAYFVESLLAEAANFDRNMKMAKIETTTFADAGNESSLPGILSGVVKSKTFWISQARSQSLLARDLLVLSIVLPSGNRYEGYVYAEAMDVKTDPKTAIDQNLSFNLTDEFFTS